MSLYIKLNYKFGLYRLYKSFASCDAPLSPISLFITPNLAKVPAKLDVTFVPAVPNRCIRRFPSVRPEVPVVTREFVGVVVFSYLPLLFLVDLTLLVLFSVKAGTKATTSHS